MSTHAAAIRAEMFRLIDQKKFATDANQIASLNQEIAALKQRLAPKPNGSGTIDQSSPAPRKPAPAAPKPKPAAPAAVPPPTRPPMNTEVTASPAVDKKAAGARLKSAIEKSNWPIAAIAREAGISPVSIYDACYGKRTAPQAAIDFLHLSSAWHDTGEGEMFLTPPPDAPAGGRKARQPRKARAKRQPRHQLAEQLKSDGMLGGRGRKRQAAPSNDLAGALRRAADAAEAVSLAKDELRSALAAIANLGAAL